MNNLRVMEGAPKKLKVLIQSCLNCTKYWPYDHKPSQGTCMIDNAKVRCDSVCKLFRFYKKPDPVE